MNTSSTSPMLSLRAAEQQIQWVRRLNPSIVHIFKPKGFGGIAGRALSRAFPIIVDSDDWEGDGGWNQAGNYAFLQQRMFEYQEQSLLRSASHVTAASTLLQLRAQRLRRGAGDATVHRIENGLTCRRSRELSNARALPPSEIDPPVIVLYSRFAEFESGWLAAFVDALSSTVARHIALHVVGDPRTNDILHSGTDRVSVSYLGFVSSDAIPSILGGSTLAAYPYRDSLITRSKQSVKLLELMAAGCPVVASDVGDVATTVGEGGVVVSGASPETFASAVNMMLGNPARLDAMSVDGQTRVREKYGFNRLALRLLDVYRAAGLA